MVAKGEWGDYERGKKKEYGEFVRKASGFVYAQPEPWRYNARGKGGRPPNNDPRALVVCLLLKIWLGKPYRDTVSFLSEQSTDLWATIGLRVLPGRMDLQRAMNRLTREYLTHLNSFIVEQGYYAKKDARREDGSAPLIAPASR